jgi:hypothetical protein
LLEKSLEFCTNEWIISRLNNVELFLTLAIFGVIIMIGGTTMVLATVIPKTYHTFSTVSVEKFSTSLTMESHSNTRLFNLDNDALLKKLLARQGQLNKALLELKQVYFDVCENSEIEIGSLGELNCLELTLLAQSEYLKKIWREHNKSIIRLHGENIYNVFKNIVGTVGQIRKNVSNILRTKSSPKLIGDVQFKPSAAFAELASQTSQKNFNYH